MSRVGKYLDPKSDIVFKKIFGNRPHLLVHFLNSVLPLPADGLIESLTYLTPEEVPTIPVLKRTIVDVKCKDQKGRYFIVEMQLEWMTGFMQRMLFNASQAYVKQLGKGEGYRTLCPVYGLGIVNAVFDHASEEWYHHYQIVNVERPRQQLTGLEFVFLELPKFKPSTHTEKRLQTLWLRFLSELDEKSVAASEELLQVPEINEAVSLAEESGYSVSELDTYYQYWDTVSTEKTLMEGKYAEGEAKGRAEGKAEGKAVGKAEGKAEGHAQGAEEKADQIARSMKASGMNIADIARYTGFTEDEVKQM